MNDIAVELATGYVSIVPSAEGIGGKLAALMGGPAASAGEDAGKKAGGGFASGLGTAIKVLAVPALAVGIAAGLVDLGAKFQGAFNTIRVQTGQTGAALAGLEGDFKKVLASGPDSFNEVALAVSKLRVGLGVTGKPLQDIATQVLDLSRITKTDLGANLQSVTTLFNNFGVSAGAQKGKLDELFRASQATGVSVSDLATAMATGGSVLRTAGFSFESSAAILGLLAKAGIATSTVMPALSRTIKTAAKEGKSASVVFQETFDAIKNAPDATSAAGKAIEVFGAKAGPKLADAIRSGRLSFEELAKSIASGGDTIAAAADQTATLGVKWKTFTNGLKVAVEPVATAFLGLASSALDVLAPALAKIPELVKGVVKDLAPLGAAVGLFFAALTGGKLNKGGLGDFAKPIVTAGRQIRVVFDALAQNAQDLFAQIRKIDWAKVFTDAKRLLTPFAVAFKALVVAVAQFAVAAWPVLVQVFKDTLPVLKALAIAAGVTVLAAIKGLTVVVDVLKDHASLLRPVLEALAIAFVAFKVTQGITAGAKTVATAFDTIRTSGQQVITRITAVSTALGDFFAARGGFADTIGIRLLQIGDAFKGIGSKADGSRSLVGRLFDTITIKSDGTQTAIGRLLTSLGQLASTAAKKILVQLGIQTSIDTAGTTIGESAAGSAGGDAAAAAAQGFIPKIKAFLKRFGVALGTITAGLLGSSAFVGIALVAIPATIYAFAFPDDIPILADPKNFKPTFHIGGFDTNKIIPALGRAIKGAWDLVWKNTQLADLWGVVSDWLSRSWDANAGKPIDFHVPHIDVSGLLKSVGDFFTKDLKLGDKIDLSGFFKSLTSNIEDAFGGSGGIRGVIDDVRKWIGDTFSGAVNFLGDIVDAIFGGGGGGKSKGPATGTAGTINPSFLDKLFQPVFDWLGQLPGKIASLIPGFASSLLGAGIQTIVGLVTGAASAFPLVANFFVTLPGKIVTFIGNIAGVVLPKGIEAIFGFVSGLFSALPGVVTFFVSLPGKIVGWIGNVASRLVPKGLEVIFGFIAGIVSAVPGIPRELGGIAARIPGWLGNVGNILFGAGKAIIGGFLDGLKSAFGAVKSFVGGIAGWVHDHKGPLDFDRKLLIPHGKAIMQGLDEGLRSQFGTVKATIADVTGLLSLPDPAVPQIKTTAAPAVSHQDLRALQGLTVTNPTATGGASRDVHFNGPITAVSPPSLARAVVEEMVWDDKTRGK